MTLDEFIHALVSFLECFIRKHLKSVILFAIFLLMASYIAGYVSNSVTQSQNLITDSIGIISIQP